ncbi:MAG: tetratricopeptide repeat protein [Burkholderiales bacterium]|nr:tetratricopeptide repeat protein [Burkholderiales bacterium]
MIEHLLAAAARARGAGDLAAAELRYREILALEPAHAAALHDLGVIAARSGRLREAAGWYERALAANPEAPATYNNLGVALMELGEPDRAIAHLRKALELKPDYRSALGNLGSLLMASGDAAGALACHRRAAELDPDDAAACRKAARAMLLARGAGAALPLLARAVHLDPRSAEAQGTLGAALCMLGRPVEAMRHFSRALELDPGRIEILADLVHMRQHVCDWAGLAGDTARIRGYVGAAPRAAVAPFYFMVLPGTTAREQRLCAEKYARALSRARRSRAGAPGFESGGKPRRRLRVGYLTAHFHDYATTRLIVGVLERHDRSRFEIVGISCDPDTPRLTSPRVRAALDDLMDLRAMTDAEAAGAIHARGIDLLIDGQGYNRGARPGVLARRPAPVQAAWLVYPGTTGTDFIDYLIADRYVIPEGLEDAYTETVKYLAHCYQCNDDRRPVPAALSRAECGLPETGLVLCCFNQTYKITPDVFDIWCRLIRAVPGSVLWLWASSAAAPANLRREAENRGVAAGRLVFAPTVAPERHLRRMAAADLFLDTFPCTAHTTASDALWAGLPVLTCAGETFVSRAAGSVVRAAGFPEMVTGSFEEYEARALELMSHPATLADLRRRIAANRATAPLFDTGGITRELEALYVEMWKEKAPPAAS